MSIARDVGGDIGRAARDYLLFRRWSLIDADELEQRRTRWPRWRRMVRPIGALLWWPGVVATIFRPGITDGRHRWSASYDVLVIMIAGAVACFVLGTGLEWRDRRRDGYGILGLS